MHVGTIENKNYGKAVGSGVMGNIVRRAGQGGSRFVIAGCTEFIDKDFADDTYDKATTVLARVIIDGCGTCSLQLDDPHSKKPSNPHLLVLMMSVDRASFSAHQRRDGVQGFDDQVERGGGGSDVERVRGAGGGVQTQRGERRRRDEDEERGGGEQGAAAMGEDLEDLAMEDAAEDVIKRPKFDSVFFDDSVRSGEQD